MSLLFSNCAPGRFGSQSSAFARLSALSIAATLAGCGGGSSGPGPGNVPAPVPSASSPTTTQTLAKTVFSIVVPPASKAASGNRVPAFVSSASLSITITLTSVGGNPPNVSPTAVTSNISGSSCTAATPCQVNGPPSPPGQVDTYSLTTYDAANGAGNALDTATVSFTPTVGTNNVVNVTLLGIPFSVSLSGIPGNDQANTSKATALTVLVADHSGQTIVGTYATPITLTDPDAETTNGTHLTGTNLGSGCTNSCVTLKASTDTATLNYGGLAENPVVLTASGSGVSNATGTFTPLLNAIASNAGSSQTIAPGGGDGIDLFTNSNTSASGYTGSITYSELGFTNTPYSKSLSITGASACSTFATVTMSVTVATATAVASPVAGTCKVTVTDALTDQTNPLPTFTVTYTTSSGHVSAKPRSGTARVAR